MPSPFFLDAYEFKILFSLSWHADSVSWQCISSFLDACSSQSQLTSGSRARHPEALLADKIIRTLVRKLPNKGCHIAHGGVYDLLRRSIWRCLWPAAEVEENSRQNREWQNVTFQILGFQTLDPGQTRTRRNRAKSKQESICLVDTTSRNLLNLCSASAISSSSIRARNCLVIFNGKSWKQWFAQGFAASLGWLRSLDPGLRRLQYILCIFLCIDHSF